MTDKQIADVVDGLEQWAEEELADDDAEASIRIACAEVRRLQQQEREQIVVADGYAAGLSALEQARDAALAERDEARLSNTVAENHFIQQLTAERDVWKARAEAQVQVIRHEPRAKALADALADLAAARQEAAAAQAERDDWKGRAELWDVSNIACRAEIARLQQEREGLKALAAYAEHTKDCAWRDDPGGSEPCSCGLYELPCLHEITPPTEAQEPTR